IIGLDYDSFSLNGGTPYLQKALAVCNNAQNTSEKGWKAFESNKNRYWLCWVFCCQYYFCCPRSISLVYFFWFSWQPLGSGVA
ncbi:MAG: DUF4835 family protein, partial [Burkholderiaceae bacterium]|nr:DUF4835 family protein [Burkholderiaceae bacterium]